MLSHIFDIDGTLTKSGHDLWFLTMQELCEPIAFKALVTEWEKKNKTYEHSYQLLVGTLKLLRDISNPEEQIFNTAKRLTLGLIDEQLVPAQAILTLRQSIRLCDLVVLNTANYSEAAKGFTAALLERDLISLSEYKKLVILATNTNWADYSAECFNMGDVKIHTYYRYLQREGYPVKVPDKAFVDDPFFNDASLANDALEVVVVDNSKNKDYVRKTGFERVFWY
ncbi:hypothetical protein RC083_21095 [Pseudoalteromonas haloplanktis]|uniref:Haloacid dehalogenase n=1 Tax=Pseudoalteromonas haloplanktis TaxID=228 RepID=A0ABU1BHW3_PSEHA|nr:hypothetical protein [Pseudoalteromonas haloplanktis]MDQ9094063.1 hypothetical protein [Pseudoalteromonas haloplanktis]